MDQFLVETLQAALGSDSLQNSHPISVPVHDPAEINEIFDSISYDKVTHKYKAAYNYYKSKLASLR